MAAAMEERTLEEQRKPQARQHEERKAKKVCKFAGADSRGNMKIIQTSILGLPGTVRLVAAMCEHSSLHVSRGRLHVTGPGALGLCSRKSSRMLAVKSQSLVHCWNMQLW